MKILKKIIIALLLSASTAGLYGEEIPKKQSEEVTNKYNYTGIGAGLPTFLALKFGHREQYGHNGFEYGIGMTPLIVVTEFHAFASYLYYPKPNLISQSYVGLGVKAGGMMKKHHGKFGYIAPGVIVGKEYVTSSKGRRFLQVALGTGALTKKGFIDFSSISLTYGFAF